ncbi:MAG TPA: selenocysteine-specific translation elongation factor [Phycisphaerae bacterium]|nr:selenocysteine-specific translation elongation factor [Phycisphaerae bacterium]
MANVPDKAAAASVAGQPRYCILGTAGHIDHGKSALVKALTGTDPDRLPEEQARGMTIELGFAHLNLPGPSGEKDAVRVGIVDVPGHERFVRTMVAGATGIDLGMLVVAADDGVMPQTREHVDILDLLGVRTGLVAISKADLVPPDRIQIVRSQITALVQGTTLAAWPIVPTSAKTRQGLDELCSTIARLALALPPRDAGSIFRLAIDRVFAIHGRGTVVTGSVLAGKIAPGATLELQPPCVSCKVREVQTHGAAVQAVGPGQRAALNLTGIDREQIERGMELATPGYLAGSRYVDAKIRLLSRREKPLPSHRLVRISMGTSETMAMLVVVGGTKLEPGKDALVQLRFERPVCAAFGERFILRNETAQATLGGGHVVRPISRRVRPKHPDELEALQRSEASDAFVRLEEAVRRAGFQSPNAVRLACEVGIQPDEAAKLMEKLRQSGRLTPLSGGRVIHKDTIEAIQHRALAYLTRHHAMNPLEPGILRDRFVGWIDKRSAAGLGKTIFERLETGKLIVARGPYIAHHEFKPAMSAEDSALLEKLVKEVEAGGLDPPTWSAMKTTAALAKQRAKVLEELAKCDKRLVPIGPQQFVSAGAMARLKETVRKVGQGRHFKLAEVRDELQLSRRAVQPLLEYLDRIHFTRRVGDERVLMEGGR